MRGSPGGRRGSIQHPHSRAAPRLSEVVGLGPEEKWLSVREAGRLGASGEDEETVSRPVTSWWGESIRAHVGNYWNRDRPRLGFPKPSPQRLEG